MGDKVWRIFRCGKTVNACPARRRRLGTYGRSHYANRGSPRLINLRTATYDLHSSGIKLYFFLRVLDTGFCESWSKFPVFKTQIPEIQKPVLLTLTLNVQEFFGGLLWQKCKSEGNRKKFYMIMNELINLRTTIREVDVSQVSGYKRRVILTDDVTITGT